MEKILEINNLRVSFRTNDGTVKAVRNISLDLNKGETLAIVGESGSGKSVTAKAVLGILAPNSIIESGEIIYDGKDLLKITEDDFHDYRGSKLSMIFQDPMSSLNPIMRIGKQLTEAMILNGKANQRTAKKEFNSKIKLLNSNINKALNGNYDDKIKAFNNYINKCIKLEKKYNTAHQNALNARQEIEDLLIDIIGGKPREIKEQIKYLLIELKKVYNPYVVKKDSSILPSKIVDLSKKIKKYKNAQESDAIIKLLKEIKNILDKELLTSKPDFFSMGINNEFMQEFKKIVETGISFSNSNSLKSKAIAVNILEESVRTFESENLDKKLCAMEAKKMIAAVENSIDRLEIKKDSCAYTFGTSILSAIDTYFKGIPSNAKESKRFEKESAKLAKLSLKGKSVHKATPALIVDLELVKNSIIQIIKTIIDLYKKEIGNSVRKDIHAVQSQEMIEYLKAKSSARVYKVTANMAKNNAIKLMKEVGIAQPRKRFKQFPFQFSGGMRQRIVIAIALSANPDILICDEPTTALDVTIQAQILELINKLKEERQLSIIFITHDLGVVANMADRIAVMYAGKVVEYGTADEIFYEPAHPYTWALLASIPDLETREKLDAIPGTPPNMIHPPVGDAFAVRNKYALQIDFEQEPPLFEISKTHYAATWLLHPKAPMVKPPKIVTDRIEALSYMEVAESES